MQRPVMDPSYLKDNSTGKLPLKVSRLRWLLRALGSIARVLFMDLFRRRRHMRIEDGKPIQRFLRGLIYRMALLPALLVGFVILLVLAATHPGRQVANADPLAFGVYYDPVSFLSEDGVKLEAWLVPAVDAKRVILERESTLQKKSPAVVLVHDFAASRQQLLPLIRPLHDAGFVVLALGLRGSGAITGEAQTFGLNESMDVRAAVDMLRRRSFVDSNKIAVLGSGSGANAALLAARKDASLTTIVISNPINGFDEAFARRVGSDHAWLPPLRPLFRWTFEVIYRVDSADLQMDRFKDLIEGRHILVMDARRDLTQPGAMRDVGQFLAHRMGVVDSVAGAR